MNKIMESWQAAIEGERKPFTLGGFKFNPGATEFDVHKDGGHDLTEQEITRIKLNLEKSTGREWASMGTRKEHKAHYWLMPLRNPIKGEPVTQGLVVPTRDNQEFAEVRCHHHGYETCTIPLSEVGTQYERDCRYGTCGECGKTFLSFTE